MSEKQARPKDFLRALVAEDLASGKYQSVVTRFPPEPNGFLHIGHAKAITVDFQLALENPGGRCHLRFDDTNPVTEDPRYVKSIQEDIRWLGYDWGKHLYYASDYYPRFYEDALRLIEMGKAYICDLSEEEFRECRGTVDGPGKESPYRDRSAAESKDLLERMNQGEFPEGSRVLRAKIDMTNPNMKMRDPPMYRIKLAHHFRTGDTWKIYPIYDFAHPLSDCYEGVTHSLCSLEFENNRELYDWYLDTLGYSPRPYQTEFARLKLGYTVMSKRKLLRLVEEKFVSGWDDPRMPTIAGLRRRGVTPDAIRSFIQGVGVAKANSVVDIAQFEYAIRDDLNHKAPRVMAVLDPLKVTITNYPEDHSEEFDVPHWPHDVPKEGSRSVPFSREIFIERSDFSLDPPKGFRRLSVGKEVRLRYAYFLKCVEACQDSEGNVTELKCTYDPDTKGGDAPDGRKVQGTIHWVDAASSFEASVRVFDRLFLDDAPDTGKGDHFLEVLNPKSLVVQNGCRLERSLASATSEDHFQFERLGYFVVDSELHSAKKPVFNRVVALKDSWARKQAAPKDVSQTAAPESPKPNVPQEARDYASELDETSKARFLHLTEKMGLGEETARVLCEPGCTSELFDEAIAAGAEAEPTANLIANTLVRLLKENEVTEVPFQGAALAELIALETEGKLSRKASREVLAGMMAGEGSPASIMEAKGLSLLSDPQEIASLVEAVLTKNPEKVATYKAGKTGLRGFFVGQIMKASQGRADPKLVQKILSEKLS